MNLLKRFEPQRRSWRISSCRDAMHRVSIMMHRVSTTMHRVSTKMHRVSTVFLCASVSLWFKIASAQNPRTDILLNTDWRTTADDQNKNAFTGFEQKGFNDK